MGSGSDSLKEARELATTLAELWPETSEQRSRDCTPYLLA
jgi:hypothetical protein